ncbi:MAG: thioredoxin family protein [Methanosarcinaceae archaeon]
MDEYSFNEQVLHAGGMVLVNIWAWWSDECRIMSSLMRNVAELLDKEDTIVQIDWEQQKHLTQKLEVFGVPTLLIYIDGCEAARRSGTMNRDDLMKLIAAVKSREQRQWKSEIPAEILRPVRL